MKRSALTLGAALAAFAALPSLAGAVVFAVDATADAVDAAPGDGLCATAEGACTLRAAVMEANALPGADEITLPAGVYGLTIAGAEEDAAATGDLDLTSDLILTGEGADRTVVQQTVEDRVFDVHAPAVAAIEDVRITGGRHIGLGAGGFAGGVYVRIDSSLDLRRSWLLENTAVRYSAPCVGCASGGNGGAVLSSGDLRISDSTISQNTGLGFAGGIGISGGQAEITNSTISNNTNSQLGASNGIVELTSCTLGARNDPALETRRFSASADVRIRNTIIDGESCDNTGPFRVTSFGYNIDDGSCGLSDLTDLTGDANLENLLFRGGSTPTRALFLGSIALDSGAPDCPAADQRGVARPQDGDGDGDAICDRGAFEFDATCTDADGDGFHVEGDLCATAIDCDDTQRYVHPGATEICNGVDDDCDVVVDESEDLDGDGFTVCGGDCHDRDSSVFPGAVELCNGEDDDCDGVIDEEFPSLGDACDTVASSCGSRGRMACSSDGLGVECLGGEDSALLYELRFRKTRLGVGLGTAGDVNADGVEDFIVNVREQGTTSPKQHYSRVFSGANGLALIGSVGPFPESGNAAVGVGDVDGDALDDIAMPDGGIGGIVRIYSGASGSLIHEIFARTEGGDRFGTAIAGLDDQDDDGLADFAIGATQDWFPPVRRQGYVQVFSGGSGSVLATYGEPQEGANFGAPLQSGFDFDRDGYKDLLVLSRGFETPEGGRGRAQVISVRRNDVLWELVAGDLFQTIGSASAMNDYINGDDVDDFVVFGRLVGQPPDAILRYYAVSGPEHRVLYELFEGSPQPNGYSLPQSIPDFDGDGVRDLLAGNASESAAGIGSGIVSLVSGIDGSLIFAVPGRGPGDSFGIGPRYLGDANGDGFPEFAAVAQTTPEDGNVDERINYVRVFTIPCIDSDCDGFGKLRSPLCRMPLLDCDDADPTVHPLAREIPGDGIDQNCNGTYTCGGIGEDGPWRIGGYLALLALPAFVAAVLRRPLRRRADGRSMRP